MVLRIDGGLRHGRIAGAAERVIEVKKFGVHISRFRKEKAGLCPWYVYVARLYRL